MSESKRNLQEVLAELHGTLQGSEDLDQESRAALASAVDEIRSVLDQEEDGNQEGDLMGALGQTLKEALERFEERHPQLTGVVGRVADALADLGI